jgi:hypothetical protein
MTDAGGYKRKQEEHETEILQRMTTEIDDIVNKHGQVPDDDRVLDKKKSFETDSNRGFKSNCCSNPI